MERRGGREGREVVRYVEVWRDVEGREGGDEGRGREDGELERVKHRLAETQILHDELSQKYIAVSEKVCTISSMFL